jgi:hypothetical protein
MLDLIGCSVVQIKVVPGPPPTELTPEEERREEEEIRRTERDFRREDAENEAELKKRVDEIQEKPGQANEDDLRTHEVLLRYRELTVRRGELDIKREEQSTRSVALYLQALTVAGIIGGVYWGSVKFDHQKEVEGQDRYRQMSQPYREMELSRLVRMVDAAGTIAARYPGDTADPSYREAIRTFSNDFFSSKVFFLDSTVGDAADDFALAAEHCTGEPIRGMPPQEGRPDGMCSSCIRKLAQNLSIAARSQVAREWDQKIEPHLGNDADDCTNWAHQFRIKK